MLCNNKRQKITATSMHQVDEQQIVTSIELSSCRSARRRKRGFDEKSYERNVSQLIIESSTTHITTPPKLSQINRPSRGPNMLLTIFLVSLQFGHSVNGGDGELPSTTSKSSSQQVAHHQSNDPATAAATSTTATPTTDYVMNTDNPISTTSSEFNDLAINERGDETGWLGLTSTSESPSPLSTTSSFDRFVLGNDESGLLGHGNSSDIDYILANTAPTGTPDAVTTLSDQLNIDNGHQSSDGEDNSSSSTLSSNAYEQKISTSTEADINNQLNEPDSIVSSTSNRIGFSTPSSNERQALSTTLFPSKTEKPMIEEETDKGSTIASNVANVANATSETLNSQLIRNRKSSDNGTKTSDTTNSIQSDNSIGKPNASEAKNPSSFGSFVEYDDFDLDYQLKLNTSSPINTPSLLADVELSGQNLNKRDNNLPVKAPDWTALIGQQPHVFSPSNTSTYFHHHNQQAPPMIPSLLTVKSTQLTSQELNKMRPQFMLDQDQDSNQNTYLQEQNQAFATGDLIATASAAGAPSSSALNNNNSGNFRTFDWLTNKEALSNATAQSMINLMNGSPILRNNQYVGLFDGRHLNNQSDSSRILEEINDGVVTTIVVDNTIPTEASTISHQITQTTSLPQQATNQTHSGASSSIITAAATTTTTPTTTSLPTTTTTTTTGKPDSSQTNQWYNYPHPNLHHNPLLLHHILNKPTVYAQHVGFNQANGYGGPTVATTAQATPVTPPSATPLVGPLSALSVTTSSNFAQQSSNNQQQRIPLAPSVANRATNHVNIIEKPTLGSDLIATPPSPINRTQLQMQINEMRAIAASNSFKQNGPISIQSPATPTQIHNLVRSDINQSPSQQYQQVLNSQQHRSYASNNAPTKPLPWQKQSIGPGPSDFLSHLIGSKTILNVAMPSNFHPTFATIRPPTMRAPNNFHGEESSITMQSNLLPVTSTAPPLQFANRYPNMNVMHHLFGNNLSGTNMNHPLASNSISLKPIPGALRQLNSFNGPIKAPPIHPINIGAQLDHLIGGGTPIHQLHHHQRHPMFKTLQAGPKIMTSPSLLQEVYTARPATMSTASSPSTDNQVPTATPCPVSSGRDSIVANQTVIRQSNELSRSASSVSQKQSSMSDEDMSTYVAQLASLSAQVNQSPSSPDPSLPIVVNASSPLLQSSALNSSPNDVLSFVQQQQQKSHPNSSQENFELLTQKILDVIAQQAATGIQQSLSVQMQQRQQQQQQQQQQLNSLNEILRNVKLVGLPDEVQAQIYRELGPILQSTNNPNKPAASPPYSAIQLDALNNILSTNKWPKPTINTDQQIRVEPSSWRRPVTQMSPIGSIMSDSQNNNYYYNIDSHQKQQKKDREEQQVLNSERQRQKQRQKQIAFIEALRTSVMKMHNQAGIIDSDLDIISPSKTSNGSSLEDLTSLANSIESTNITSNLEPSVQQSSSSSSIDDFDEQSKDPIPEWLERQIIQESLVHETSRVHPFGQTTKSTIIGSPFRPISPPHLIAPIIARPSAPAAIIPPAGSHLHPTRLVRPIYPLNSLHPAPSQLHPLTASAHYHGGPVGRLTPVRPISPHMLFADGSQPPAHHSTLPFMAASSSSLPATSPIMPPSSLQQLQLPMTPVNPTKLLSDRFPFASAPAYLVKLPTLSGGTITASGSLVPPSRLLASHLHNRPIGPLRFLSSAPPRIRLMSNMMQSAPSIIHAHHQPPTSYSPLSYNQAPSNAYNPMYGTQSQQHHHQQVSYQNLNLRPFPYSTSSYYNQGVPSVTDTLTLAAHTMPPNQPSSELVATSSAAMGTNLPGNKLFQMNFTSPTPLIIASNISSSQQNGIAQMNYGGLQQGPQPIIQQQSVSALSANQYPSPNQDIYVNHPLHHAPIFAPAGLTRYQQTSPSLTGIQQIGTNSPTSTLSRLQQATASLVELTSLASLVEEMVGGTDIESSPAVALANAINSLSQAQDAALNTQASTNGLSSTAGDQSQQQQSPQQIGGLNQVNGIFSWKNLLNPILWRDKSLVKSSTLERLVAARKAPTTRLKVKYIRVPVAVYETSGNNNGNSNSNNVYEPNNNNNNNNNNNGYPNQNQLITKTQLAEIIATGSNPLGGSSASSVEGSPGGTSVVAPAGVSTTSTSLGQAASIPSGTNQLQANGNSNQNVANSVPAASSADYLFDELSMDSVPKLALALANPAKEDNRIEYLPIGLTTLRQPLKQSGKSLTPFTGNGLAENSLESALFYSLLNPTASGSNNELKIAKLTETSDKKKKRKKSKKGGGDDDDEEPEEDDDDDLITANDLPILESLISTVIHGSPHHQHASLLQSPSQQSLLTNGAPAPIGWRPRSPFGGLRGEASSNMETYVHPVTGLNPFSKHSHRFSLGEVVGAIGVRKLISSLLNKRKISRTNKREVLQNNQPDNGHNHDNHGKKKYGTITGSDANEFSRSTELPYTSSSPSITTTESVVSTLATPFKYPPMAAYDSRLFDNNNRKKITINTTSSRPAKRKLNDLVRPVISSGGSSNNFTLSQKVINMRNSNNGTDKDNGKLLSIKLSENHSAKRFEASTNQVIDLNPKESTIDQTKSSVVSKPYNKAHAEEQVQFKFLLKPSLHDKQVGVDNDKSFSTTDINTIEGNEKEMDKNERRKENKMAMPLYYVVADHYNKLQQGRSQRTNNNSQQQHANKSTVRLHDNNISANRLQANH